MDVDELRLNGMCLCLDLCFLSVSEYDMEMSMNDVRSDAHVHFDWGVWVVVLQVEVFVLEVSRVMSRGLCVDEELWEWGWGSLELFVERNDMVSVYVTVSYEVDEAAWGQVCDMSNDDCEK